MTTPNRPRNGQVVLTPNRPRRAEYRGEPRLDSSALTHPSVAIPRPFTCALATGGLLWLCYFPAAWSWLAWVALVPLLGLVRMELSTRRRLLVAWLAGLVFFFPILQWMRVADY